MSENPPFTPPPPPGGMNHHLQHHGPHGFKMEPPHIEPLRLHNGHGGGGGPGSPTPPPPGPLPPPVPWPPGQTITENTASFLNSANPPPPPPPPPPSSGTLFCGVVRFTSMTLNATNGESVALQTSPLTVTTSGTAKNFHYKLSVTTVTLTNELLGKHDSFLGIKLSL